MRRFLSLLIVLAALQNAPASAQGESVTNTMDTAWQLAQSGQLEDAAELIESVLAADALPGDHLNALIILADIRSAQSRPAVAAQLAERAITVILEHDRENVQALTYIYDRAGTYYFDAGDRENWFRVGEILLALVAGKNNTIWDQTSEDHRHLYTQAMCPAQLGPLQRAQVDLLREDGLDVGCQYTTPDDPNTRLSVYISRYDDDLGLEPHFRSVQSQIEAAFDGARLVEEGSLAVDDHEVMFAHYRQGASRTATWMSQHGHWVLKIRLTHQGYISDSDAEVAVQDVFGSQSTIANHIERCASIHGIADFDPASGMDLSMSIMAGSMLGSVDPVDMMSDAPRCYIGDPGFQNPSFSSAWTEMGSDGEPYRMVALDHSSNNHYSVAFVPMFNVLDPGGPSHFMWGSNSDGRHLFTSSSGLPTPEYFLALAEQAGAGELSAGVSLVEDEDGNTTMVMHGFSDDLLDEETP
jgi:hypothetical protein